MLRFHSQDTASKGSRQYPADGIRPQSRAKRGGPGRDVRGRLVGYPLVRLPVYSGDEIPQPVARLAFPQPEQRPVPELTNPLAGDAQQ